MNIRKENDGWWIVDVPDTQPCGPYAARADAAEDMRGLRRFFRYGDDPEFFCCERRIDMKTNDVKVGGVYTAKVTDKLVPVRIDAESRHGGWEGTNMATGKKVRIKSPQRLRAEVKADGAKAAEAGDAADAVGTAVGAKQPRAAAKPAAKKATTSPTAATGAKDAPKATTKRKGPKAATRAKQGEPKAKKPSGLDAAAKVLAEAKKPMTCREIVDMAFEKKYWKSGGKTPAATVYSAMIREIATDSKKSRFKKVERGKFVLNPAATAKGD